MAGGTEIKENPKLGLVLGFVNTSWVSLPILKIARCSTEGGRTGSESGVLFLQPNLELVKPRAIST